MAFFVLVGIILVLTVVGFVGGKIAHSETPSGDGNLFAFGSLAVGIVLTVVLTLFLSFNTVQVGNIGIIKSFGNLSGTTGSGVQFVAPWQSVDSVSVQNTLRTYEMDASANNSAVSKDSQPVYLTVQVNYQLKRDQAVALYKETGGDYVNRVLDPAVYQFTKEVTAEYRATDFAANREQIRQKIEQRLTQAVGAQGIHIYNVTLKNVGFTPALTGAIERTVESIQNAKQAQAQVQVVEAQAQQKIAQARGDAEAQKLRRSTLTPALLQQEAIQALNSTDKTIIICQNGVCPSILPLTGAGTTGATK